MMSKKLNKKFYQNIAKIFYAIAKADKTVAKQEVAVLKKIVKDTWLQVDETFDVFGTDTAYQIEIVFDWLLNKEYTSKDCYADFMEYYRSYPYFFTNEIKKLILETSGEIANAFAGKNKSELIILAKLSLAFNPKNV